MCTLYAACNIRSPPLIPCNPLIGVVFRLITAVSVPVSLSLLSGLRAQPHEAGGDGLAQNVLAVADLRLGLGLGSGLGLGLGLGLGSSLGLGSGLGLGVCVCV